MDLRKIKIFISYAAEDMQYLNEIKKCINPKYFENITVWDDGKISGGTEWDSEIKKRLNEADIILLLMSRDFLNSEYIFKVELDLALKKHSAAKCRVIPILIRNCLWRNIPEIASLQGFPKGKFISDFENPDKYYTEIEEGIKTVIKEIRTKAAIDEPGENDDRKKQAQAVREQENAEKKVLLARANSELGKLMRDFFKSEADKEREFKKWEFTVDDFNAAEGMLQEQKNSAIYTVHISTSEEELLKGIEKEQYEQALGLKTDLQYHKSIIWISSPPLLDILSPAMKSNKVIIGTKPIEVIDNIKALEEERQQLIKNAREEFSPQMNVYMLYNFEKDHTNDTRIKLKNKLENRREIVNYFSPPDPSINSMEEQLKQCKGAIIFYGRSEASWYCYWQAEVQKIRSFKSRAICISEPDKTRKLDQDVSRNAFLIMDDEKHLDEYVDEFISELKK